MQQSDWRQNAEARLPVDGLAVLLHGYEDRSHFHWHPIRYFTSITLFVILGKYCILVQVLFEWLFDFEPPSATSAKVARFVPVRR